MTSKPARKDQPDQPPPRIASDTLLRGGREIIIIHNNSEYHLRLTAQEKLILTK
ncbi:MULTISPECIES: hemin uptake protein HemP [Iodidimonas]|jgi:hemin uptake protein HemP|uniref:Hemin uptake protein HemP n=1 Tax=Iodidimonas nitroreducens TaxID=1236968 RepID=A0A5A7N3C8_9PROT|nr:MULTISPECIES: hemin uptake protein HemP [Iodidimonas]GAK32450.1 hemin uptake protein [alpha proteobacterium Q-1]GER02781.1 hypothetical protein JCM17846_04630 [Iodidimonas nitroreducens]